VLVEQVDPVGAEAPQRVVDAAANRLRPAIGAARLSARELEAELRRDHDPVADRLERFADELLVVERAVDLRGVEERDAALDRGPDQGDSLLPRRDRREALAQPHAAEPERGDLEALSESAARHARGREYSTAPGSARLDDVDTDRDADVLLHERRELGARAFAQRSGRCVAARLDAHGQLVEPLRPREDELEVRREAGHTQDQLLDLRGEEVDAA